MPDIGSTLREARMRERIDITEVEAQTKIRAKYLRAIENEEWDLLPGTVYAKSFLRTYGDYLGLDSRMLIDEFRRRYEGSSEHDMRPVSSAARRERERRPPPRRAPAWVPIAAVLVVVLVVLFAVGELLPGSNTTTTNTSANRPATHHHVHAVLPKTTTTPPPPPTKVTLKLIPTNAVYVCLVNGAGTKLINEQTFTVGQTIPTETASRLLLTLGNNSVDMKVNGKSSPVAASAAAIRLMITPAGVRPISSAQQPTCP
jgi:cytoskeleton protein RodZ